MSAAPPATAGLAKFTRGAGRLALVVAAFVLVTAVFALDKALPLWPALRSRAVAAEVSDIRATRLVAFKDSITSDLDQFEGRSFFFTPPRPVPPAPPPLPPKKEENTGPPSPPKPPSTYGGPPVIGVAGGYVWFNDGKKMKVGAETENDIRVISVYDAPWTARIEWKGVEFDVPFIARDTVVKSGAEKNKPGGAWEPGGLPPPAPPGATAKPGDKPPGDKPASDRPKTDKPAEEDKKPVVKPPESKPEPKKEPR